MQKQKAKDLELKRNTHYTRLQSQAFRNWQQVGPSNFNSSSAAHRGHNLTTSPTRRKVSACEANTKFFEHLKSHPRIESVQIKTPLNRKTIDTFSNTMSKFNKRSGTQTRPVSSTLAHGHSGIRAGQPKTTRSGATFNTGVMSLVTHENKYMPQAQTFKSRSKSGCGGKSIMQSRAGFNTISYNQTPITFN